LVMLARSKAHATRPSRSYALLRILTLPAGFHFTSLNVPLKNFSPN